MKVFPTRKIYYEIEQVLGEGLTSQVFRAYRRDSASLTQQKVALKVIKSKKHVQNLKKEFEKLLKVHSKYCIKVMAWEHLKQGPCLVLEYVDGVTLKELYKANKLDSELVAEIICQVRLGLQALHRSSVYHGDLNLKNILIDRDGLVKLIDFGFFTADESYFSPQFAAPQLMAGGLPTEETDFYSLKKVGEVLNCEGPEQKTSKASHRRKLGQLVTEVQNSNLGSTCVYKKVADQRVDPWKKLFFALALPLFFIFLLTPENQIEPPRFGSLEVRSRNWVEVSFNNLPNEFGPLQKTPMRVGRYSVRLSTSSGQVTKEVRIQNGRTFLLQPLVNKL